jgi:integrase
MRAWNKLSAAFVRSVYREGLYSDGGNLYLQVTNGGKSWVFQYQRHGCPRYMGLGSVRHVSLALARELRDKGHEQLARGIDPIEARNSAVLAARAEQAKQLTFRQCAEDYLEVNASRWRNAKHRKQWVATLTRYVYPVFGNLPVAAIDSGLVFAVLKTLVADKAITASRVRGRIETVLDFAKAIGRRDGDNPADKAVISHLLPMRSEKADVEHQPALPFAKVPAFMSELRTMPGLPARMLELIILSGMRLNAVRPARCGEFDLGAAVPVWVIPEVRMKNLGRDHRMPLVGRALVLARELTAGRDPKAPVFGVYKPVNPNAIGKSVLPKVLKAIGHSDPATTHGFRSCLKDWCHETTSFPHEVVEQAIGHRIKSSVERAYRRGDLFERRRALMAAWDRYCNGEGIAEVIELPAATSGRRPPAAL